MKSLGLISIILLFLSLGANFQNYSFGELNSKQFGDNFVEYDINGGTIHDISLDFDFVEMLVEFTGEEDGMIQISIPRQVLDASFEGKDDIFFVLVDGFETNYVELAPTETSRTLLVPFFKGDSILEIFGTEVYSPANDGKTKGTESSNVLIPDWVKSNAGWWSEGLIEDSDFVQGLQFLISAGIMEVPKTDSVTNSNTGIPEWIKSNAGWWSEGKITDIDFVSGVQYLISNGIISV